MSCFESPAFLKRLTSSFFTNSFPKWISAALKLALFFAAGSPKSSTSMEISSTVALTPVPRCVQCSDKIIHFPQLPIKCSVAKTVARVTYTALQAPTGSELVPFELLT